MSYSSHPMRGSHTEMCQFESEEDAEYRSLVGEIGTYLASSWTRNPQRY